MIFGYLFLIFLLGYLVLLLLPKGNLFQEIGQMPWYLLKVKQAPLDGITSVKYTFGNHRKQYFILFQSEKLSENKKPVIVYYHGGGWTFGTPENFAVNAKFFIDLGYTVVMPSYRRMPFYRNYAIAEDRILALQKIRDLMQEKGWGDKKIILGGMSAGGNVAALLLYDRESLAKINVDQSEFAGIMLHGAPLNLAAMMPSPLLYCYAGRQGSASFAAASPISYLKQKEQTPVLIIHGTKDGLVHYNAATSFVNKLKKLESKFISFHTIENGSHLEVGKWCFEENRSSRLIREWLLSLEE